MVVMQDAKEMTNTVCTAEAGFQYQVGDEGIIYYYLYDLKKESIDQLTSTVIATDKRYAEADRHCRSLTDISRLSFPNAYAMKSIFDMIMTTPDTLRESVAILTPANMIYTYLGSAFENLPVVRAKPLRLFLDREKALNWLDQRFEELGP